MFALLRISGLIVLLAGCGSAPAGARGPVSAAEPLLEPPSVQVLYLVHGTRWRMGEPIGAQNMEEHFDYVRRMRREGILVANGVVRTGEPGVRGIYILALGSAEEVQTRFVAEDPAVINHILGPDTVTSWTIEIDNLNAGLGDGVQTYLVDYAPAGSPSAASASQLSERMAELGEAGWVLMAGPTPNGYRAILAGPDRTTLQDLVNSEPPVSTGDMSANLRLWIPAQRGSLQEAQQRQGNTATP